MKKFMLMFLLVIFVVTGFVSATGNQEGGEELVLNWPHPWVAPDSKAIAIAALVERFNTENEGKIRIEVESIPDYNGYKDKISTMMASGKLPDLFNFTPNPTQFQYYDSDLLMDFTDDLKGTWSDEFVPGFIETSTKNNRTKTIPYEIGLTPIWYNSELLADVGYDSFPATMEEFWDMADALKAQGIVPTSQMTGGGNAFTSMLWFSHIVGSLGGPDVWSKPLSDPLFTEAAQILLRLYQDGNTTKDAVGGGAGESGGHYMAGDTAVFINGPWYIGRIRIDAPDTYKATKLVPAPKIGDYYGHQIGFKLTNLAAANTKDPQKRSAVVKWMKYLTDAENVKFVSESSGSMFAIKYDLSDNADPLQLEFVKASSTASFVIGRFIDFYPVQVVDTFKMALGAMALGEATPSEFIQMLIDAN